MLPQSGLVLPRAKRDPKWCFPRTSYLPRSEPFAVPRRRWCCSFPLLGNPAQAPTHLATDARPQLQRAPPGACRVLSITSNLVAAGVPSDASSTSRENAGQPG